MIAALVDPARSARGRSLFRDRDVTYWLARFYPYCHFFEAPQPPPALDFLFVFSADIFPVGSPAAQLELRRWLQKQDRTEPWLVAPENMPFFILSRAFLKEEKISLQPGIFKRLLAGKQARRLALRHSFCWHRPSSEARRVEAAVVDFQIGHLQRHGVRIEDNGSFFVSGLIPIGKGTVIGSGVVIKGESVIGRNVRLYPGCFIEDSCIGHDCLLLPGSIVRESTVENGVQLGPYCHLRNETLVKAGAKVGNFVEMKKSRLGQGSKAMHLTYIGDAQVGEKVNIGAGTITCNYDGEKKNPTFIGDNVFIGSGTELVAPLTVHSNSYIGAGSTITEDVPENALAVARERQKNISNWALRKRKNNP